MRVIRLALGIWVLAVAIQTHEWPIGAISGIFIFMALTNTGCCGADGCAVRQTPTGQSDREETVEKEIEEINN